jgi:hypothetical protein
LRAHVLELVFELDLLGDGDAVLSDARRAVTLVEDDIAAFGPERHPDTRGELTLTPLRKALKTRKSLKL